MAGVPSGVPGIGHTSSVGSEVSKWLEEYLCWSRSGGPDHFTNDNFRNSSCNSSFVYSRTTLRTVP